MMVKGLVFKAVTKAREFHSRKLQLSSFTGSAFAHGKESILVTSVARVPSALQNPGVWRRGAETAHPNVDIHGTSGAACPIGHFCPVDLGMPLPCPVGTFSDRSLPGQASCFPCPAGYYCPENITSYSRYPCPAGFYCPRGTKHATQFPCPRGYYNPDPLTHSLDSCLPCPPGHYCGQENLTKPSGACDAAAASHKPIPCPAGTFSSLPEQTTSSTCRTCPSGFYCKDAGLQAPSGWCPAGYYCDSSSGPVQDFSLYPCPRGYYCPVGTAKAMHHSCPVGTYGPQKGLTSITECQLCPAGKFCSLAGITAPTGFYCSEGTGLDWQPCPPGTYGYEPGLNSLAECQACDGGRFCPRANATEAGGQCWEGFFCTRGSTRPNPEAGTEAKPKSWFQKMLVLVLLDTTALEVQPCLSPAHLAPLDLGLSLAQSFFCPANTSSVAGNECPAGHYCPASTTFASQFPCPRGMYKPQRGGVHRSDCSPCEPGTGKRFPDGPCLAGYYCPPGQTSATPMSFRCPQGFYCPEGSPQPKACGNGTFQPQEAQGSCELCPMGFYCEVPSTGNPNRDSSLWCLGQSMSLLVNSAQDAFPCPAGTFRLEPGASSPQDCELCPSGYHCPDTQVTGHANVFAIPCQPGTECPAGAVDMVPCRAGSYCGPRTGVPPLCPGGFACPAGSSTYTGPGQRCIFPYYCPQGSTHPLGCPGGSEALNKSSLRVSSETSCRLCMAGTYRSPALDTLTCQPCPPGFICPQGSESYDNQPCPVGHYCPEGTSQPRPCPAGTFGGKSGVAAAEECQPCPPDTFSALPGQAACLPCGSAAFSPQGSSTCTCRGLNRIFQKSDGSCICQAGHVSYDDRGLESDQESDSHSDEDCQPQVAQHCPPGDVRLAATRECVSPQQYDCTSFCGPGGGRLSAPLGICQCLGYVSAEELCDIRCLANAPRLSLSWDPGKEVILSVKSETGDSIQKELLETLGPDLQFPGSSRVHLVQFGPHGTFGFIISRVDMLNYLLQGTAVSSPWLQRHHRATDPKYPNIVPQIPNPVICLAAGDVILFQLHLLPHNRLASHYPMYQRQHLLNSNSHWDSGAFRRLGHLVRETNLSLSRFAHQFLDPGTYVFQDNGNPENIAVVSVKEEGAACGAGLSPVQPSSPYQLGRLGVLRHRMLRLGPDWAVITGDPLQTLTLEDFSVRTLYDKLEDQSLHIAAQLSRHRKDALAFYGAASQQLQALQASSQHDAQSCFTGQKDSPTMGQPPFHDQEPQMEQPPFHDQEPQRPRPQQDIKGQDAQTLNHEKWILGAGLRHRPDVELQKKTWQVEEALDKLNEEFFWLSAQALELQKKGDKLDRLPLGEDNISMSTPALMLEVRRIHLAQRIEDLEWELSLLLQTSSTSSRAEGSQSSHSASQHVPESPWMLRWPPVGCIFSTKDTTTSPC
ncbi:putative gene 9195 [Cricetulus griseus]